MIYSIELKYRNAEPSSLLLQEGMAARAAKLDMALGHLRNTPVAGTRRFSRKQLMQRVGWELRWLLKLSCISASIPNPYTSALAMSSQLFPPRFFAVTSAYS